MGRKNMVIKPSGIRPENSRVKRYGETGWTVSIPNRLPSEKYFKNGVYEDHIVNIVTPSGKRFACVGTRGSFMEIPPGEKAGYFFERILPKFWASLGISKKDILFPAHILGPTNQAEEFSDGVILFGDTAFLIQAKVRTPNYIDTYQMPDKKKRIIAKITEAKTQFYSSLKLAKDYSSNKVEMSSLSGEKRVIEIDKYNWVSLNVITRNYFGETDSKLVVTSEMTSTLDAGFSHVNHVVMSLQGIYNLSKVFTNSYELLSFFKMLSYSKHEYEIGKELELVNEVYGKYYGLEDNSLALIGLLNKITNDLFNDGKINKIEAKLILAPIYSKDKTELEELFVNVENNFCHESPNKIFIWNDGISNFYLRFDRSGRYFSVKNDPERQERGLVIQDENSIFRHEDSFFKIDSNVPSKIDYSICDYFFNDEETLDRLKDSLNSYSDIAASKVLELVASNGYKKESIIKFGNIMFVIQIAPILYEKNYENSLCSHAEDYATNESRFNKLHNSFSSLVDNIKKNPIMEAWDGDKKIKIEANKYTVLPLLVLHKGLWTPEINANEVKILLEKYSSYKKLIFTTEELEYAIQEIEYSGMFLAFLRRLIFRPESQNIEKFKERVDAYLKLYEFKNNIREVQYFIHLFNHSIINSFDRGRIDGDIANKISAVFDVDDIVSLRKKLILLNKKIEKSKNLLNKYTFHFDIDNVKVYFTICYSITMNDSVTNKLIEDLLSRIPDPAPKLTVGILADVYGNSKSKHGLFFHRDRNEAPKVLHEYDDEEDISFNQTILQ